MTHENGVPQGEYEVWLLDTTGTKVAVITDYVGLAYTNALNQKPVCTLTLDETTNRDMTSLFGLDYQIVVYRTVPGLVDRYVDFEGFHRDEARDVDASGRRTFVSTSYGYIDLLSRRAIQYASGSGYASKRGYAETVMKAFVSENAGSLAVLPYRRRSGQFPGFSVETDLARGPVWTGDRGDQNLLQVLQGIALETGLDFDVVGTGPATFEFRVYYPQRGTDRRAPVIGATGANAAGNIPKIFSLEFGTMATPKYLNLRGGETAVVTSLGTGQFGDRKFAVIEGDAAGDSPWNDSEAIVNSQSQSTIGLVVEARTAVERMKYLRELTFQPVETRSSLYGRDYVVGDYITARMDEDTQVDLRILSVSVTMQGGVEQISISVGKPRDDHG